MQLTVIDPLTEDTFVNFVRYLDASPRTIETYSGALKQFWKWLLAHEISSPTREDLIQYRNELRQTKRPATTQLYLAALRQFFRWAEYEKLYPNITEHLKGAKLQREHKKDPLTSTQIQAVLEKQKGSSLMQLRDYAILSVAVTGGLRTIELARANVEDIRNRGDSTVLYIQGKGRLEKSEYIKLPTPVLESLMAYLAKRNSFSPESPLFISLSHRNTGCRLTTRSLSRIIKTAFQSAGYCSDRLTAHSLRHTAATLNLLLGGTLEETQQLLRHSNINTTMLYLHHLERDKNQSEDRIAQLIFSNEKK